MLMLMLHSSRRITSRTDVSSNNSDELTTRPSPCVGPSSSSSPMTSSSPRGAPKISRSGLNSSLESACPFAGRLVERVTLGWRLVGRLVGRLPSRDRERLVLSKARLGSRDRDLLGLPTARLGSLSRALAEALAGRIVSRDSDARNSRVPVLAIVSGNGSRLASTCRILSGREPWRDMLNGRCDILDAL